tara:strand:- start:8751 stop:9356 length:606 start_codon:yes stop_codon:yes gene_type:complete
LNTLETIWQGLLGASWIEQVATLLGLTAVWLATRQRITNFPIGMVQVVLTGIIFARHGLFADMTLQAVYFVALAYGWWCWTHPGDRTRLPVTTLAGGHRATLVLGGLLITAIWGALLVEIGDPMPWRDAFIASFGVIAQWLEAHKKLEAWIGWMAVNIAGIGVYAAIGLYWFVGLYGLYLVLSFTGFWRWQADRARSLEQA